MAKIDVSNSWGTGFDMSYYSDDGWAYLDLPTISGTLYTGYNSTFFNAYGYYEYNGVRLNYTLYGDMSTVVLHDLVYYWGSTEVLELSGINVLTTMADLNAPSWYVRYNQGNDTFYGNDYADYIKGGWGDDMIAGYLGNDTLMGGDGNDDIGGGGGNDYISGGAGYDVAGYGGVSANYTFTLYSDGSVRVQDRTGGWGTDTVVGVEAFRFDDGTFSLSSLLRSDPLPPTGGLMTGTSGADTLTGTSAANVIKGLGGADRLSGGGGNDTLYGGAGNDTLTGGTGKDSFVFDAKPNRSTNRDTITDFKVVDDTIRLDNAVFTKVGANGALKAGAFYANLTGKAHDRDDRVIYEKDTGKLFYDADGTGSAAAVHFATVGKNLAMTSKDFYVV